MVHRNGQVFSCGVSPVTFRALSEDRGCFRPGIFRGLSRGARLGKFAGRHCLRLFPHVQFHLAHLQPKLRDLLLEFCR